LGEFAKAAEDLEHALRLKPDYQEASDVLAQAQKKLTPKPAPPAEVEVETAKEIIPEAPSPIVVPVVNVPYKSDPKSAAVHNQRGRDLLNQGHYQQAIDELTAAVQAQPDLALAYNARGFTYFLVRDTVHALADLDEAIRLNPAYANAYHNRSVARNAVGDKTGSAADEARSRELNVKK